MRRQLAIVSLAVTTLIVIAFVVPLGLLARSQAEARALLAGERRARLVSDRISGALERGVEPDDLAAFDAIVAGAPGTGGLTVYLPNGLVVGADRELSTAAEAALGGTAYTADVAEGAEVLVPLVAADGVYLVSVLIDSTELTRGLMTAWLILGALGLGAVVLGVVVTDRLGRSFVKPVTRLAEAAHSLGTGDLEQRVQPDGPPEVREVGTALNELAGRLGRLLAEERESVADLSHRLRTPLTAIRLQVEALDADDAAELLPKVDRLEGAIDRLINDARAGRAEAPAESSDLGVVARQRAEFWRILAEEQERGFEVRIDDGAHLVPLPGGEAGAVIDTLVGNVFKHTPPGTAFELRVSNRDGRPTLTVSDAGPGFASLDVVARGTSGAGSTGLGLDIVRKTARRTGGDMQVRSTGSGAVVSVRFGSRT